MATPSSPFLSVVRSLVVLLLVLLTFAFQDGERALQTSDSAESQSATKRVQITLVGYHPDRSIEGEKELFLEASWKAAYYSSHRIKTNQDFVIAGLSIQEQSLRHRQGRACRLRSPFRALYVSYLYDVTVVVSWYCKNCWDDNWDRALKSKAGDKIDPATGGTKTIHDNFEEMLCAMLQKSPFEDFHTVLSCEISFLDDD